MRTSCNEMAHAKNSVIGSRLRAPVLVVVDLKMPVDEAVGHLQRALADRASVELGPAGSDRRLSGEVSAETARLTVTDANWRRRRVGWSIEFEGTMEAEPGYGVLSGVVAIEGYKAFHLMMTLFRAVALIPILFAIAAAVGRIGGGTPVLLQNLGFAVIWVLAVWALETSIQLAAADDARVLVLYLQREVGR